MERVWVYARIPFHPGATNQQLLCNIKKAEEFGYQVVGSSTDSTRGWLHRPGLKEMLRHVRSGEVDRIYIESMGTISHRWCHLIAFFKEMTDRSVQVQTAQYSLRYVAHIRGFGAGIETRAIRKGKAIPWD